MAVNQVTHTIYVGNSGENTVSVIDGTACNAIHTSGCGQTAATVTVGSNPLGVAIDQATNTIYVANAGENTVSVINGATCNRTNTSGCGQDPPTVTVGGGASLLAVDPATDTIYVGSFDDGTISVIDGATCNGGNSSGCAQVPPTVTVGSFPDGVAVDQATHTVYVANGNDTTVSVIDGSRCNGTDSSGCGQTPPTVDVGGNPVELAVDQATDTVYVPIFFNDALGFVAMIDTATCNGGHSSGCSQPPLTAPAGSGPTHVTLNPTTHTVYVMNELDSSVSALNATTCNATVTSGCAETPPAMAMGFNGGAADVDLATDTVYASSQTANSRLGAQWCPLQRKPHLWLHPVRADDDRRVRTPGRGGESVHTHHLRGEPRGHGLRDQRGRLQRAQRLGLRPGHGRPSRWVILLRASRSIVPPTPSTRRTGSSARTRCR